MPMYEYTCRGCGEEFELLVRTGDTPACPYCQAVDIERMLSMFAVSSAERSQAALASARERYRQSKTRLDRMRHEREEIREHLQEDYGIDLNRKPDKPAQPAVKAKPDKAAKSTS
jgi:putative FmdB family regulatory protein